VNWYVRERGEEQGKVSVRISPEAE